MIKVKKTKRDEKTVQTLILSIKEQKKCQEQRKISSFLLERPCMQGMHPKQERWCCEKRGKLSSFHPFLQYKHKFSCGEITEPACWGPRGASRPQFVAWKSICQLQRVLITTTLQEMHCWCKLLQTNTKKQWLWISPYYYHFSNLFHAINEPFCTHVISHCLSLFLLVVNYLYKLWE